MAELHVQRKEGSAWPWILAAAIVLALLAWFFFGRGDAVDVSSSEVSDSTMVAESNSGMTGSAAGTLGGAAVTQYLQFVDNQATRPSGVSHNYTADGLRQLASALSEVAGDNSAGSVAVQPRVDEIRERADAIQQNPQSTEHALQTREAFTVAAALIEQMQGARGTSATTNATTGTTAVAGAEAQGALTTAAMAIDPARPLLDQTAQVDAFFSQAANALRTMTSAPR